MFFYSSLVFLKVFVWKFIDSSFFMVGHWSLIFPLTLLCRQCACRLVLIAALEEAGKQSLHMGWGRKSQSLVSLSRNSGWLCGGLHGEFAAGDLGWAAGMVPGPVECLLPEFIETDIGLGLGMVLICERWAWHWYSLYWAWSNWSYCSFSYWSTGGNLILGSTEAGLLTIS